MSIARNNSPSSEASPVVLSRRAQRGVAGRALTLAALGALASACEQQLASAEQLKVSSEPLQKASPGAEVPQPVEQDGVAPDSPARGEDGAELELRRGYGAVDMRFNACVTRPNDFTLHGEGCPPSFVIYGPYVAVPASSEIEVSFEIKANKAVEVYSDIVSQMGTQTLAGLNRTTIDAGKTSKLGYRVHVFNADVNVESRIGMSADPGTTFEISNLTMTVR